MRYLIIGLGIYGENLARDLVAIGHEVIAVDVNPTAVDNLKDYVSAVYMIDATEESQLSVLPLSNIDLAIVAIGENFGASVKAVALLKKLGVKHIYARAIDPLHKAILEGFEIDRIITPEQRAAYDLSHELELGAGVVTMRVCENVVVVTASLPDSLTGISREDLSKRLSDGYNLTLVAICRPKDKTNILGIKRPELNILTDDDIDVAQGDRITVCGSTKDFRKFCRENRNSE